MLVSVIVPVYNGGAYLDRCAPSLLEQSLPTHAYEVIYVDDGSTDDSSARLQRIAQRYPHARVLTQENSGWPGKPRNVGIDASTADYVQFVDQDDELGLEALERLTALASAHQADIVLGKMGGTMAGPNAVFARNVETATLDDVDAIDTLTGHKMFRRDFLNEHGIRFPEGYWRMEDLLFVTRAYAHNPRLAVLADYVCYWWQARDDGGNHSQAIFDLPGHYARLRVLVAALRDHTEPGERQDRLLRRYYRVETMSRVAERAVAEDPDGPWRQALPLVAGVARDCFPPGVRAGLPALRRRRAELVEAEDHAQLYDLSTRLVKLAPVIERRGLGFPDGVLRASLRFRLEWPAQDGADGSATGEAAPFVVVADGEHWRLDPALAVDEGPAGIDQPFDVEDPLLGAQATIRLEDAERAVWWYPDAALRPTLEPTTQGRAQVVLSGDVAVDPTTAAAGGPLTDGRYTVWLFGEILGVGRRRRLVMPRSGRSTPPEWSVSAAAPIVSRLDWSTPGAKLQIVVRDRQEWLAEELRASDAPPSGAPTELLVQVPGQLPAGSVPVTMSVADQPVRAELLPGAEPGTGVLRLPPVTVVPMGRYPALVAGSLRFLAEVESSGRQLRWRPAGAVASLPDAQGVKGEWRPPRDLPAPSPAPESRLRRLFGRRAR